jgi:hypothetical protein
MNSLENLDERESRQIDLLNRYENTNRLLVRWEMRRVISHEVRLHSGIDVARYCQQVRPIRASFGLLLLDN